MQLSTQSEGEGLLTFVQDVTGREYARVEEDLGEGFVRLHITEAERRQARHDIQRVEDVVVEMLRNSRDAGAQHILVATNKDNLGQRLLVVADDGEGIPESLQTLVFEPRVTSKLEDLVMDDYGVHGRGMALFSIHSAASAARLVVSQPEGGSVFFITLDSHKVPERTDQSTFPELRLRGGKREVVRGPRNIPRTVCEFSIANPGIKFYLGSPAEVVSTMRLLAGTVQPAVPWRGLAAAGEGNQLATEASALGLSVSERTAHRILRGDIRPLLPLPDRQLSIEDALPRSDGGRRSTDLASRIGRADLDALGERIGEAAAVVAERYFLAAAQKPEVRTSGNRITVHVELMDAEE